MTVQDLDAARSPRGTRTVILDNGVLRLELFPDRGAKIFSLFHKPAGKEILWRNPSLAPGQEPSAVFDDSWIGGWDELFPNDEPATVGSATYPDHGELWDAKWQCDVASTGCIHLQTECPISRCRVEKWISMDEGADRIRFRHRLTNLSDQPLHYLWKLHPALAVSAADLILMPARKYQLEPEFLGSLGGGPVEWSGPLRTMPDKTVDVRVVPPPESRDVYFFYGLDLTEGWCASYDPRKRLAVALCFPKELFNNCWLFASYGGWRDHYVAVLEPCTAYPFRLEKAIERGQCPVLPPHGQQEAEVIFSTRHGIDGVRSVSADGDIQ